MGRQINQDLHDKRRQWAEQLYKAHYTATEAYKIIGCPYVVVTVFYKEFKRTKVEKFDRSILLSPMIQNRLAELTA